MSSDSEEILHLRKRLHDIANSVNAHHLGAQERMGKIESDLNTIGRDASAAKTESEKTNKILLGNGRPEDGLAFRLNLVEARDAEVRSLLNKILGAIVLAIVGGAASMVWFVAKQMAVAK